MNKNSGSDSVVVIPVALEVEPSQSEEVVVTEVPPPVPPETAGETVSSAEEPTRIHPLTEEGYAWAMSPTSLGCGLRPTNFVPVFGSKYVRGVNNLFESLGRSVTLEEYRRLVGDDGNEKVHCSDPTCTREFVPVWWVRITDRVIDAVREAGGVTEEITNDFHRQGHFFSPDGKKAMAFCGSPFMWDRNSRKIFMPQSHYRLGHDVNLSPEGKPLWGLTRAETEDFLARKREFTEKKAKQASFYDQLAQKRQQHFGGNRDWHPSENGNGGNGHGYRGQHGKTARREEKRASETLKRLDTP